MKKILSFILAVLLVFSVFPISAFASNTVSGELGNGVTWEFDPEETSLTISGEGPIPDYPKTTGVTSAPWGSYATIITKIIFEEGINSIGKYAFYGFSALKSIDVPFNVASIGQFAFGGCNAVESASLPFLGNSASTSTYLGYIFGASSYSKNASFVPESLKTVKLIDGFEILTDGAFYGCSHIENIILPDTLTTSTSNVFTGCDSLKLTEYNNAKYLGNEENPYVLLYEVIDRSITSFNIPVSTRVLHANSFSNCDYLKTITIPENIKGIGYQAFYGCVRMYVVRNHSVLEFSFGSTKNGYVDYYAKTIVNSDGTKQYRDEEYVMDDDGFLFKVSGSNYSLISYTGDLTTVTLPLAIEGSPYSIYECDGVVNIIIPEGFTEISYRAFCNCSTLKSVVLPESLTTIGNSAFYNCNGLTEIKIPDNVTNIEYSAFSKCTNLKDVKLSANLGYLGGQAFSYTAIEEIEIPKTLFDCGTNSYYSYEYNEVEYTVYGGPFFHCESLKKATFAAESTQIAENVFRGCTGLETVTMPDTVTLIESSAFEDCFRLKDLYLSYAITSINGSAFDNCCSLKNVILPSALEYLGGRAFAYTAIEEIEIPKALKSCGTYGYYNYDFGDKTYRVYEGPFYRCDFMKTATFEANATEIAENLFCGCMSLKTISIPDTVTTIENSAFSDCLRLTDLHIGSAVTKIGYCAFQDCASLESVDISDSVTSIEQCAFENCTVLKSVKLPKSLTYLGGMAFSNTAIEEIEIPRALERCDTYSYTSVEFNDITYDYIYRGPFYGCDNMKTATFQTGTTEIAENLFSGCMSLEALSIPDTVTTVESSAFSGCIRLKDLYIGDAVTKISSNAFEKCASLEEVSIPDSVTSIDYYAFDNCTVLKSVKLSDALTYLGARAFAFTAIEEIEIPKSLKECGSTYASDYEYNSIRYDVNAGPFYYCQSIKTVVFETGIAEIPCYLFAGCMYIDTITIPDTVKTIERCAFQACLRLQSIEIPMGVLTIEESAFKNCASIKSVVLPDSLNTLGYSSIFEGCTSLEYAKINDGITQIKQSMFKDCSSLATVVMPDSVTSISNYAFENCTSIKNIEFSSNLTTINYYSFHNCTALEGFSFRNGKSELYTIGRYSFCGCTSLKEAILPTPLDSIEEYAFYGCSSLEKILIPHSCRSLGRYAFYGCEAVSSLTIEDYSITTIPEYCFYQNYALEKVVIPKGCQEIKECAFKNNTKLFNVTIPTSVTTISSSALSYPKKTTIYGSAGSYAETFADKGGFTFVDNKTPTSGISLLNGVTEITLECGEEYYATYDVDPVDSTDVVWLTSDNNKVSISMNRITSRYKGDSIITINTTTGISNTFTVHNKSVSNISVTALPSKVKYELNEELQLSGMAVTVTYSDNSTKEVTDYTVTGFDSTEEGLKTLTVTWYSANGTKFTTETKVSVVDSKPRLTGIYIKSAPSKTTYNLKENLDTNGLVVMATYNNATEEKISFYTLSPMNNLKVGKQTITATASDKYGTYTADFEVEIIASALESVTVKTNPNKTTYYVGEAFESDGLEVTLHYSNSTEKVISSGFTLYGFDSITDGVKTITVTFGGKSTTFDVNVIRKKICTHKHTEIINAKDSTCYQKGYSGDTKCLDCGEIISEGYELALKFHTYETQVVAPTVHEDGYTLHTCSVCKHSYKDSYIAYVDETAPCLSLTSSAAQSGESFIINLSLKNNTGVSALVTTLKYDKTVFTLTRAEGVGVFEDEECGTNFVFVNSTDITSNETIANIEFTVNKDAKAGDYVIEVIPVSASNSNQQLISFTVENATIAITDILYGDCNGDKNIDAADLFVLKKYLANYNYNTKTSSVSVEKGADCNGDGTVDGKDLVRLKKYFAYYNHETGTSEYKLGK